MNTTSHSSDNDQVPSITIGSQMTDCINQEPLKVTPCGLRLQLQIRILGYLGTWRRRTRKRLLHFRHMNIICQGKSGWDYLLAGEKPAKHPGVCRLPKTHPFVFPHHQPLTRFTDCWLTLPIHLPRHCSPFGYHYIPVNTAAGTPTGLSTAAPPSPSIQYLRASDTPSGSCLSLTMAAFASVASIFRSSEGSVADDDGPEENAEPKLRYRLAHLEAVAEQYDHGNLTDHQEFVLGCLDRAVTVQRDVAGATHRAALRIAMYLWVHVRGPAGDPVQKEKILRDTWILFFLVAGSPDVDPLIWSRLAMTLRALQKISTGKYLEPFDVSGHASVEVGLLDAAYPFSSLVLRSYSNVQRNT